MTADEQEFTEKVRRAAFDLVGLFGAIDQKRNDPAAVARMADKGMKQAFALVQQAGSRQVAAGLTAEHADLNAADYDLNALAVAPPPNVKE